MLRVSFIVPCLNSARTIEATLRSLLASELSQDEREIIVVDNGSQDETIQIAENFPVIITTCDRQSASAARNHGAKLARGEFLAFIDSDVVVEPQWARELLNLLEEGFYSAALGRVIPVGPETFLNQYRLALNTWRYEGTNISLFEPGGIGPVINTAACMYRKSVFHSLGGFDERLMRLEDSEFSGRVFSHGGAFAATNKARARVFYTEGILSYVHRSFKIGKGVYHVKSLGMQSRWQALKEVTMDCFRKDLSKFRPGQKIFFFTTMLFSYLGFVISLPRPRLVPLKTKGSLAEKLQTLFSLNGQEGKYALTSSWRLLCVDGNMYFNSVGSGEWLQFSREKIPFAQLKEKGVLRQLSGEGM